MASEPELAWFVSRMVLEIVLCLFALLAPGFLLFMLNDVCSSEPHAVFERACIMKKCMGVEALREEHMIPFSRFVNGKDDILEAFWGMPRNEFFANLRNSSFCAVTAPTFSVVADCKNTPASHNVCMLLRHNRVLDEIHKAGLVAIPNLYWRTVSDQKRLTEWLQEREVLHRIQGFFENPESFRFVASDELEQTLKILNTRE